MRRKRTTTRRIHVKPRKTKTTGKQLVIEELVVQPWFLPKRIALAIFHLLPPDYRFRMRNYYLDYGCLRCDRIDVPYGANGMCNGCKLTVYSRMVVSAKRRMKLRPELKYGNDFVEDAEKARKLLESVSRRVRKRPSRPHVKTVQIGSPALHTFDR